jgi:hypothetical protein
VIQVLPEPLSWWTDCFCVRSKALAHPARIQASEILTETGRRAATGCLRHLPTARHDSSCKTRAEREFKTSSIPARSLHLVSRRVGAISGMSSPQNVEGRAGLCARVMTLTTAALWRCGLLTSRGRTTRASVGPGMARRRVAAILRKQSVASRFSAVSVGGEQTHEAAHIDRLLSVSGDDECHSVSAGSWSRSSLKLGRSGRTHLAVMGNAPHMPHDGSAGPVGARR